MIEEAVVTSVADRLIGVPGIVAVTLGGSRARGDHTATSDIDLGLYYRAAPDVAFLRAIAEQLGNDPASVGRPGDWGPWVDGGAWLRSGDVALDWIYRDERRVEKSVAAARAGRTTRHVQVGHPFGFPEHAYAAEVALARPLADPHGLLDRWRSQLTPYPPELTRGVVGDLWIAEFHIAAARKGASRGDSVYVAACLSDALLVAAHAIHGLAGQWVSNEKGLVAAAGSLAVAPPDFANRCCAAMAHVHPDQFNAAIDATAALVAEVQDSAR